MLLPTLSLFPPSIEVRFAESFRPDDTSLRNAVCAELELASEHFAQARMLWTKTLGASFEALCGELLLLERSNYITTCGNTPSKVVLPQLPDSIRYHNGVLSLAALRKFLNEECPEDNEAWGASWKKILGPWIVPPKLSSQDVEHINAAASHLLRSLFS